MVRVNDEFSVNGSFSFDVSIDDTKKPPVFSISGVFASPDGYIEDLKTLQNDKYRLERIKVYTESFGSDDDTVVYHFTAGAWGRAKR